MIIMSACNRRFEKYVMPLVHSVLLNTHHHIRVDFLNDYGREGEHRRDYCANYRIQMFRSCPVGEHMLWLDADTLVRMPLDGIEEAFKDHDTLAVHLPESAHQGLEHSVSVSTVGIAGTTRGHNFLLEWEREYELVKEKWSPSIMTCQYAYAKALQTCQNWVRAKDMGSFWADKDLRPFTPIWQAQGDRKINAGDYLRELEIYQQC